MEDEGDARRDAHVFVSGGGILSGAGWELAGGASGVTEESPVVAEVTVDDEAVSCVVTSAVANDVCSVTTIDGTEEVDWTAEVSGFEFEGATGIAGSVTFCKTASLLGGSSTGKRGSAGAEETSLLSSR